MFNRSNYICLRCGSKDWTYPNPLKPAEGRLNGYQLVNGLLECNDCGHIGTFFVLDNEKSIDIQEKDCTKISLPQEKLDIGSKLFLIARIAGIGSNTPAFRPFFFLIL